MKVLWPGRTDQSSSRT